MDDSRPISELNPWRLILLGAAILIVFLGLAARLVALQIFDTLGYEIKASTQSRRLVVIPAPRGNIYDRNGRLLVGNRPARNIIIHVSRLKDELDAEVRNLRLNERQIRETAGLARVRALLRTRPKEEREAFAKQIQARDSELRRFAPVIVLQRYLDRVNRATGRDDMLDYRAVIEHFSLASGKRTIPFPLARDISEKEAARFIEQIPVDGPLDLVVESLRHYPYGESAAHILGYVSRDAHDAPAIIETGRDDLDPDIAAFLEALDPRALKRQTLKRFDGQRPVDGVEARFDVDGLRGTPGYQLWTIYPNGYAYTMDSQEPARQGAGVTLSIDIELQTAVEKALATRFPNNRAAVVVLDVKTGEVLACVNSPSIDPARMGGAAYYKEQLEKKNLFNYAVRGLYPPGSSFKPLTAIAALRSGRFSPATTLECGSRYDIGRLKLVEHDGRAFGTVNITRMLQVSSNVFCYQAGLAIGIEALAAEAKRFGLDSPTTLELAPPRGLTVPDPAYKQRRYKQGWSSGDTAITAIGQGDNVTTVVHLAAMMASIARAETLTDITILRSPDRDAGHRHRGQPINLLPENYRAVVDGLVACASPGGTGRRVAEGLEGRLAVAAKTGTAQVRNNTSTLAWTIAYAPVEKPRIALAVMVEAEAGDKTLAGGAHAGPVANIVLTEWLNRQTPTAR